MLKLFASTVLAVLLAATTALVVAAYWLAGATFRLLWLPAWPFVRLARIAARR